MQFASCLDSSKVICDVVIFGASVVQLNVFKENFPSFLLANRIPSQRKLAESLMTTYITLFLL